MAEEIVEVTIGRDGKVEFRVAGVEGMACVPQTDALVALLGGAIEQDELTAQAYVEVHDEQRDHLWH